MATLEFGFFSSLTLCSAGAVRKDGITPTVGTRVIPQRITTARIPEKTGCGFPTTFLELNESLA